MTTENIAYRNSEQLKADTLAQLDAHRRVNELVRGTYWDGHRGCAIGCMAHSGDSPHPELANRLGIPEQILHLIDVTFERLPANWLDWPTRVMSAIPVGADLSLAWPRMAIWILADPVHGARQHAIGAGVTVIDAVVALYSLVLVGDMPTPDEWHAAASAADAASVAADAADAASVAASAAAWAAAWAAASATFWATLSDEIVRVCEACPVTGDHS